MDGSNAEDRPDRDDDDALERPVQPTPLEQGASMQEEAESDVVLHSVGDDEDAPWCIGVSAAR